MSIINSKVAICNLALSHLGINEVTSIELPDTPTEKICANFYDIANNHYCQHVNKFILFAFQIFSPSFSLQVLHSDQIFPYHYLINQSCFP